MIAYPRFRDQVYQEFLARQDNWFLQEALSIAKWIPDQHCIDMIEAELKARQARAQGAPRISA